MLRQLNKFFIIIAILFSLVLADHARGGDDTCSALSRNVASALKKGKAAAETMIPPVNKHAKEGLKAAEETAKIFHSPAFQARIQHEQQRLRKEVFGQCSAIMPGMKKQQGKQDDKPVSSLSDTEKVYLFLSSSIPDATIHNYLVDIARVGDPNLMPVMRGMVNGLRDSRANVKYFSRILKEDMDCRDAQRPCRRFKTDIFFQPPLFTKYKINQVPAIIYDDGGKVFLIEGDASLDYLLERINRVAQQKSLKSLIHKLRGENK